MIPIFNRPLFLILIILSLTQCNKSKNRINKSDWKGILKADAETINKSWIATNHDNIHLRGDFEIDKNRSLSGNNSIRLNIEHRQGFAFELTNIQFLDEVIAHVWRHKDGDKSDISIHGKNTFYRYAMPTGNINGDWEELELKFTNYRKACIDTLLIQCVYSGSPLDTVWFDDFSCKVKSFGKAAKFQYDGEHLILDINKSEFQKLSEKREEALKMGVLIKQKGDKVPAIINNENAVRIRLKGDWTDHLLGDKWSMRIEMQNEKLWHGMSKFSIQNPDIRSMMNEWVYHSILRSENVLTTKFEFIPTQINDNVIGIMAVEEHFTNELLESFNRLLGPILKFDEDKLWIDRTNNKPNGTYSNNAGIKVYSEDELLNTPLEEAVKRGRYLLHSHQQNLLPLDSIFDIDLLAKYYAISELVGAHHSYIWHNTRYYYNAEKDRLEPIAYDGNPSLRANASDMQTVQLLEQNTIQNERLLNLASSQEFRLKLMEYLKLYSSEDYLDSFFEDIQEDYQTTQKILQMEYSVYEFPKEELYHRAELIRELYTN